VQESLDVFKHVDEIDETISTIKTVPHVTPNAKIKHESSFYRAQENTPISKSRTDNSTDKKLAIKAINGLIGDESPIVISPTPYVWNNLEIERQSRKTRTRLTHCKSTDDVIQVTDENNDSIGEDADVTLLNEDKHLSPALSVLANVQLFVQKDKKKSTLKELDSGSTGRRKANKSNANDNINTLQVISINDITFEIAFNYLGFYFREAYRNTIRELKDKAVRVSDLSEYDSSDEEALITKLSQKFIDDNKTHVTQSMQGLHYFNSITMNNSEYLSK